MALQSSGAISLGDINVELGRSANTYIEAKSAVRGVYGTINTNSEKYPNDSAPCSMSEWYSYDHTATAGWSLSKSILHDGVNDWSRQSGASYGNICEIFNSGGTIIVAFKCTGTTSYSNQYIANGAHGGGNNWIFTAHNFSGSEFQIRFRHDFSGNNYISEPHASSGQRPFGLNKWYFVCITYDNGATSNNATWYYGNYSGTSLTTVTSPVEITTPTGTKNTNVAQYPALSGGKGAVIRPFKGNITLVGGWSDILTSGEVTTLWNSGAPYQFSNHSNNLLYFHDMESLSGSTITPETGGSGYRIVMTDGASQSTTIPA